MHVLFTIVLAAIGFSLVAVLGSMRILLPLRAIDRLRVKILIYMVCLGMGVDDAAVERLGRISTAESILEDMEKEAGANNPIPGMVLRMLRAER